MREREGKCKRRSRERVGIEGGIEKDSWKFRQKERTFREKLRKGIEERGRKKKIDRERK